MNGYEPTPLSGIEARLWAVANSADWERVAEPVREQVFCLLRSSRDPEALHSGITPLVDRDEELGRLWRDARRAEQQFGRRGIDPGADPAPAVLWWRCPVAGCAMPPSVGRRWAAYGECRAHGALVGPFDEPYAAPGYP